MRGIPVLFSILLLLNIISTYSQRVCSKEDLTEAIKYYDAKNFRAAEAIFRCIAESPNPPSMRADALHMQGVSLFELGDADGCLHAMEQALHISHQPTFESNYESIRTQILLDHIVHNRVRDDNLFAYLGSQVHMKTPRTDPIPVDGFGRRTDVRALAIYFPQYHPDPENSKLWGPGFTEWTHVAAVRPLFEGHYQPHIPADFGFYDLRVAETREMQAQAAREAGLSGFIYYHYWFNGLRMLHTPFEEVLASGKPDFPFALCWANTEWRNKWTAGGNTPTGEVIFKIDYQLEDNLKHIRYLLKEVFPDPRYIRIDGKPFFGFHDSTLPDSVIQTFRAEAAKEGIELYLCLVLHHRSRIVPVSVDCVLEWGSDIHGARSLKDPASVYASGIVRYNDYVLLQTANRVKPAAKIRTKYDRVPVVIPSWDNSPRYPSLNVAFVMHNSTPAGFEKLLSFEASQIDRSSNRGELVVLNAWNEWGEGNHLEPDKKWGWEYLAAVKRVLRPYEGPFVPPQWKVPKSKSDDY